jgi:hypothetical protein
MATVLSVSVLALLPTCGGGGGGGGVRNSRVIDARGGDLAYVATGATAAVDANLLVGPSLLTLTSTSRDHLGLVEGCPPLSDRVELAFSAPPPFNPAAVAQALHLATPESLPLTVLAAGAFKPAALVAAKIAGLWTTIGTAVARRVAGAWMIAIQATDLLELAKDHLLEGLSVVWVDVQQRLGIDDACAEPLRIYTRTAALAGDPPLTDAGAGDAALHEGRSPLVLVHGLQEGALLACTDPINEVTGSTWHDMLACVEAAAPPNPMTAKLMDRYDVFLASYVSSRPIDANAGELANAMVTLFPTSRSRASFLAHSMGGLVVRAAFESHAMPIRRCVTLATPHAGTAATGFYALVLPLPLSMALLPVVDVPGIVDMEPAAPFIANLQASPAAVDFFSHTRAIAGDVVLRRDGLVSVQSALASTLPLSLTYDALRASSRAAGTQLEASSRVIWSGLGHREIHDDPAGGCATESPLGVAIEWLVGDAEAEDGFEGDAIGATPTGWTTTFRNQFGQSVTATVAANAHLTGAVEADPETASGRCLHFHDGNDTYSVDAVHDLPPHAVYDLHFRLRVQSDGLDPVNVSILGAGLPTAGNFEGLQLVWMFGKVRLRLGQSSEAFDTVLGDYAEQTWLTYDVHVDTTIDQVTIRQGGSILGAPSYAIAGPGVTDPQNVSRFVLLTKTGGTGDVWFDDFSAR